MANEKPDKKETEAYNQALELVTALYEVNQNHLKDETKTWLRGESEVDPTEEDSPFTRVRRAVYEGIFVAVRKGEEIAPEPLWNRAQKKMHDESAGKDKKKRKREKLFAVPVLHRRLHRLYWMVRLAVEELFAHNPRTRLGKVLLEVEKDLREAFVESDEGIKLPLALLRKKQWDLLGDYGVGLTVDEIYDLRPPRPVIELSGQKAFLIGLALGLIFGFVLGFLYH